MSNHRIKLIAAFSAIACCLGYTTALANDTTSKTHTSTHNQPTATSTAQSGSSDVRIASESGDAKSMHECHGMKVTGSDGQELGQLQDFVIDAETGKIVYAVVASSGTDGSSGALRLVQLSSMQPGSGDALTAQIDRQAFDALPVYSKEDLEKDRISMISQQSQSISDPANEQAATSVSTTPDPLGSTTAGATTPDSTPSASSSGAVASSAITEPQTVTAAPSSSSATSSETQTATHLVLASKFSGKEVRSGDETVGTIEQVALDLNEGTATAVLKANTEFAGSESKFEVPFSKLELDSSGADAVSTTLARSDFAQAQSSSSSQASTGSTTPSTATTSTDESLSATGRTDTPTTTASTDPYSSSTGATASTSYPSSSTSSADPSQSAAGSSSTATGTTSSTSSVDTSSSSSASTDTAAPSYDPDRARSGTGIPGSTAASTPETSVSSQPSVSSPDLSTSTTTSTSPSTTTDTSTSTSTDTSAASTDSSSQIAGATSTSPTATDEELSPTGREETGASRHYALSSASAAIRTALDNDQSLAGEDIRVQEAGRKIMLHGKVNNEETKDRIDALAKSAAGSIEVENKIKVEKQR